MASIGHTSERFPLGSTHAPQANDDVFSLTNEHLGTVVAVFDDRFKVRLADGFHILPFECVFTRDGSRVQLICLRSGLGRYLLDSAAGRRPA